jgi:hypothetical protein
MRTKVGKDGRYKYLEYKLDDLLPVSKFRIQMCEHLEILDQPCILILWSVVVVRIS